MLLTHYHLFIFRFPLLELSRCGY